MKFTGCLLLLFSLAAAPLAPAAVPPAPGAESCTSACCETDPECCATACPCPPLSCQTPAAAPILIPAAQPLVIFAPGSSPGSQVTDDTCSERTSRPPVPPPRA